jgi:hypothetical protein
LLSLSKIIKPGASGSSYLLGRLRSEGLPYQASSGKKFSETHLNRKKGMCSEAHCHPSDDGEKYEI